MSYEDKMNELDNPMTPDERDEAEIEWAQKCGLTWTGYNEDGLTFVGPDEAWQKYVEGLDCYDETGDYEPGDVEE